MDVTVLVTHRESALGRPSDRMRLLDDLGQRQNARLLEPRRDDLQADREPVSGLAGGDAAGGQAGEGGQKNPGDPLDVIFEIFFVGFFFEIYLYGVGLSPRPPRPQEGLALQ